MKWLCGVLETNPVTGLPPRSSLDARPSGGRDLLWFDRAPTPAGPSAPRPRASFLAMERMPTESVRGGKKAPGDGSGSGTAVITRTKTQTQRPSMYRVLLLNDDYTPMEFVVGVLCTFFHKTLEDAERIMWQVHTNGVGECGIYTYEVADTKVTQVMDHARKHQHPLQCVMEKK